MIIEIAKLLKVQYILQSNKASIQALRFHVLREYGMFEKHSGFRERAVALVHAIYELGLAKVIGEKGDLLKIYEIFWDNEYPRIGEMVNYRGFIDYLKLRETNEEEIILVMAKDDFLID